MPKSTWRVLVEARKDENSRRWLDLIADTIADQGHHVVRWRGPNSGRIACSRVPWACDLAIVFNGTRPGYAPLMAHFARIGASVLFVELGWHPQTAVLQIDSDGINADATWVNDPLPACGHTLLEVRPEGDLLVLLQCEQDSQITQHSPYFSTMGDFLRHLSMHSALPLRVRPHPRLRPGAAVERIVAQYAMSWDNHVQLAQSLKSCRAVACVNSSGAVEALAAQLPVLCFGLAVYRQPGAVYCLDREPAQLVRVTRELAERRSRLTVERVAAMLERILDHQWTARDIRTRLPHLVQSLLSRHAGPSTLGRLGWRDFAGSSTLLWKTYLRPKLRRAS